MAMIYVPDELIHEILSSGNNKTVFVKEAIREKLNKEVQK